MFTSKIDKSYAAFPKGVDVIQTKSGYIKIAIESPYAPYQANSVSELYVDEDKRKKGIGTQLLKEAIRKYGNSLSAQVSNIPSLKLHYNLGFRPTEHPKADIEKSIQLWKKNESLSLYYTNKKK